MSRVEVYYNLHKQCLSWRPIGKSPATYWANNGMGVNHARAIRLFNVSFAVQPAGRAKVIEQKRKNVHAFVRGDIQGVTAREITGYTAGTLLREEWELVGYNPYKYESFVTLSDEKPIYGAREAVIIGKEIFVKDLTPLR